MPIEEIVKAVEALLDHDLGRTEDNQVLRLFLDKIVKNLSSNPHN